MDLGSLSLSVFLLYFLRAVGGSREREKRKRKGTRRVGGKSDSAVGTDGMMTTERRVRLCGLTVLSLSSGLEIFLLA